MHPPATTGQGFVQEVLNPNIRTNAKEVRGAVVLVPTQPWVFKRIELQTGQICPSGTPTIQPRHVCTISKSSFFLWLPHSLRAQSSFHRPAVCSGEPQCTSLEPFSPSATVSASPQVRSCFPQYTRCQLVVGSLQRNLSKGTTQNHVPELNRTRCMETLLTLLLVA